MNDNEIYKCKIYELNKIGIYKDIANIILEYSQLLCTICNDKIEIYYNNKYCYKCMCDKEIEFMKSNEFTYGNRCRKKRLYQKRLLKWNIKNNNI